jgi:hypothetical protein
MIENGTNADSLAFPKEKQQEKTNEIEVSDLIAIIKKRFIEASTARRLHEDRMITAYDNFRGLYGKHIKFRESEKSRIFVKATKTKVLAGYGQVIDIVLNGERFPIGVKASKVPEGVDDVAHVGQQDGAAPKEEEQEQQSPFNIGFKGDGQELPPGATSGSKWWK